MKNKILKAIAWAVSLDGLCQLVLLIQIHGFPSSCV